MRTQTWIISILLPLFSGYVLSVAGHAALWHKSMWGFNVTGETFSYDNRPVVPLMDMTFDQWWWHGHLSYPPNDGDFLELPAGGTLHSEIACDKGATSMFASSPGGDIQDGNNPCPGSPTTAFHANNEADVRGCALAITYQSDASSVKPEDFVVFTTNQTCVWNRFTDFQVPADLPACPDEGCICSFNWIHAPDSGSEQIFMNAYRCKVTGSSSSKKLATPRLARRCGPTLDAEKVTVAPWNCTYGAKQAIYWLQKDGNTFFEASHDPPYYNEFYGFTNGAQKDIFQDSELPSFGEDGNQNGFFTLGDSSATTASIVNPTVTIGWKTTVSLASGQETTAAAQSASQSTASLEATSIVSSKNGGTTTSVVQPENTGSTTSKPTAVAVSTSLTFSSSSVSTLASASEASATTKCRNRKRSVNKKRSFRAFGAHKRLSKRHDLF